MPRKTIGRSVYEMVTIDSDEPVTDAQLLEVLNDKPGISLCVRSGSGAGNRGGYFFHIANTPPAYELKTFEGDFIDRLELTELIVFINHVSGRAFSEEMLRYCQTRINFRSD